MHAQLCARPSAGPALGERRACRPARSGNAAAVVTRAAKGGFSNETKLRSEVQAPFRVVRQFFFGALAGSAGIGTGVSFIQLARQRPSTRR